MEKYCQAGVSEYLNKCVDFPPAGLQNTLIGKCAVINVMFIKLLHLIYLPYYLVFVFKT